MNPGGVGARTRPRAIGTGPVEAACGLVTTAFSLVLTFRCCTSRFPSQYSPETFEKLFAAGTQARYDLRHAFGEQDGDGTTRAWTFAARRIDPSGVVHVHSQPGAAGKRPAGLHVVYFSLREFRAAHVWPVSARAAAESQRLPPPYRIAPQLRAILSDIPAWTRMNPTSLCRHHHGNGIEKSSAVLHDRPRPAVH
jgi:hypothetical protein